jgi:hypothetical protein
MQVVQASTATLNEELEAARMSAAAANQELSSKLSALDEMTVQEWTAQDKLRALGEEKKT